MKIKMRRVGTSWGILIPSDIAKRFIDAGEIEVVFPGESPVVNPTTGEVKADMGMQEKLSTLRTMMDMAGQKNGLTPPVEAPTPVFEDPEGEYVEDEIPEEYIMKQ